MSLKKILRFLKENYFISIFFACIFFVGMVSFYKIFISKPTYIYAKVKMGQGLWWANTAKPSIWFVNSLKKGMVEKGLAGDTIAQILSVRYYPFWGSGQYDVYLTVKLKVSGNKKTGKYNFQRSTIGVGAPIDLEFPESQVSGTITGLSEKPRKYNYVEKTVYLTKRNAYPWEYDAINIGDSYFDGEEKTVEIIAKTATDTNSISADFFGNYNSSTIEGRKYIMVKAKIKGLMVNNQFVFGEDQIVSIGRSLNISTPSFIFQDYVVGKIE